MLGPIAGFCGDVQSMVLCVAAIGGEELVTNPYRVFLPMIDDTVIGEIMRLFLSCQKCGASDRIQWASLHVWVPRGIPVIRGRRTAPTPLRFQRRIVRSFSAI